MIAVKIKLMRNFGIVLIKFTFKQEVEEIPMSMVGLTLFSLTLKNIQDKT